MTCTKIGILNEINKSYLGLAHIISYHIGKQQLIKQPVPALGFKAIGGHKVICNHLIINTFGLTACLPCPRGSTPSYYRNRPARWKVAKDATQARTMV